MKRRVLAIGTFLMLFLGLIYAWSLFAAPLEVAFNWSRSQTSGIFSISMITFCLGNIFSGFILKKYPPRYVLLFSAILFIIGFFYASAITSIWGLYISYGVLCGLGVGLSYNAILSTVPKWFPDKTGFATGTLLMGMGLGGLILGTLVKNLMDILVWTITFKILAFVFFGIFLLGSFLLKAPETGRTGSNKAYIGKQYTLIEMLKTKNFWMIFIWASLASSIGLGIVSNASYMAVEAGIGSSALPIVVGMVSIGNGLGRFVFGAIADKIGGKRTMTISNLAFILGLALAILSEGLNMVFPIAIGFILGGMSYGASPTLSAALAKKKFGEKHYPQNLSATILVLIPASLIGPTISARIFQLTGGYQMAYFIMLALALLAFIPVRLFNEE